MSQELAIRLAMSMTKIVRRLKSMDRGARLSPPCASALAVIVIAGRVKPGDVSQYEGVKPASITPLIKELARLGLIARIPDPGDKRAAWLTPTAKGKRWFEDGHARAASPLNDILASLEPELRKALPAAAEIIYRIEAALRARNMAS